MTEIMEGDPTVSVPNRCQASKYGAWSFIAINCNQSQVDPRLSIFSVSKAIHHG